MSLTRRELLCRRGFFPKELPPCFSSESLDEAAIKAVMPSLAANSVPWCRADKFSSARRSHGRRILHIVNPIPYIKLADQIQQDWDCISKHLVSSPVNKDQIEFDNDSVRGIKIVKVGEPTRNAVCDSLGFTTTLELDIARCYSSIYTHAITWALSGKATAKNSIKTPIRGTQLDKLAAACNEGQTKGITVGQDTSRILAEVVLSSVDSSFHSKMTDKFYKARRYIDDYRVYVDSQSEAQHALYALSEAALDYELEINPEKTRILSQSNSAEVDWITDVREAISLVLSGSEAKLISGFSTMLRLSSSLQDENVMRYFVEAMYGIDFVKVEPQIVCSFLLKIAEVSPNTLDTVILLLIIMKHVTSYISHDQLSRFFGRIIANSVKLGRDFEVCWALWGAESLGIRISEDILLNCLESNAGTTRILARCLAKKYGLQSCLTGPARRLAAALRST